MIAESLYVLTHLTLLWVFAAAFVGRIGWSLAGALIASFARRLSPSKHPDGLCGPHCDHA